MAEQTTELQGRHEGSVFRRHRHLGYRGHAFPWYVRLFWLGWAVFAVVYFVRWVVPAIP